MVILGKHTSLHKAWGNHVHRDSHRCFGVGNCPCQQQKPCFCDRIRSYDREGCQLLDTAVSEIHNPSPLPSPHSRKGRFHAKKRTQEIVAIDTFPLFGRHFFPGSDQDGAEIIDQDIQAPESILHSLDQESRTFFTG